ncbi:MAG: glycosyltransferase family 4 protein [Deltaproteobacteria bacterium]
MKIAVNVRYLLADRMEGIARFNYETLRRVVKDHPEDEFYFFFDRPYSEKFIFGSNVRPIVLYPPTRHPLLIAFWLELRIKSWLKKLKPDIFLSGDTYMPLNPGVRSAIVSHDLAFLHFPEHMKFSDRLYYNYFFPKFHRRADRIIAVSEFTKKDIIENYKIEGSKIDIVHNAANGHFYQIDDQTKAKIKAELTAGNPYFVYLGSIHPRKNIINLIRGFEIFKEKTNSNHYLVIIGRPAWKTGEYFNALNNSPVRSSIITRQIKRESLPQYIGSADALFYVSFFEGFGIPILEGFEAGIPVVTSNTSSMPEVAGDAALLVDPDSPEAIAGAMQRLVEEPGLSKSLIQKGKERLNAFCWDKSAEKIYSILREIAEK